MKLAENSDKTVGWSAKNYQVLTKIAEELKPGATKGFAKEMKQAEQDMRKAGIAVRDKTKADQDTAKTSRGLNVDMKELKYSTKETRKAFTNFTKVLFNAKGDFASFFSVFKNLPLVGGVFGVLAGGASILDDYINSIRIASKMNVTFGETVADALIQTGKMAMSMGEFAEFTTKYAGAINRLGIPAIAQMSSNIRSTNTSLAQMGLTTSEMNDYLGQYLEQERLRDGLRERNEQRLQQQFENQMENVYEIARLTGRSLDEVFQEFKKMATDPTMAALLGTIPEEARAAVKGVATAFPQLVPMVQGVLIHNTAAFTEEYTKLLPTGLAGELDDILRRLKSGSLTAAEGTLELSELFGRMSDEQVKNLMLIDQNMGDLAASVRMSANQIDQAAELEQKRRDAVNSELMKFQQAIVDFSAEFRVGILEAFFGDMGSEGAAAKIAEFRDLLGQAGRRIQKAIIEGLGGIVEGDLFGKLADNLEWATEKLAEWIRWALSEEGRQAISNFIDGLKAIATTLGHVISFIGSFFSVTGAFGVAIIGGLGLLFSSKILTSLVAKSIGGLFGAATGGAGFSLRGAGRLLTRAPLIAGAYGAFQGATADQDELSGRLGYEAGIGDRVRVGISEAVGALTFGLLDAETSLQNLTNLSLIGKYKVGEMFGGASDEVKSQILSRGAMLGGAADAVPRETVVQTEAVTPAGANVRESIDEQVKLLEEIVENTRATAGASQVGIAQRQRQIDQDRKLSDAWELMVSP